MTKLETLIWSKLKEIPDPELNVSIVDLGLIYGVKIKDEKAKIKMTLTTIGCPLFGTIQKMVENKLTEVSGVKVVETELVFEPPWSMDMISEEAKIKLGII
jgi:metal-sulfur cluster biosynthetic enzyme